MGKIVVLFNPSSDKGRSLKKKSKVEKYLKEIDRMAEDLRPEILLLESPREKIDRINHYLFQEKGFTSPWIRGDPNDLYLNQVLERKTGELCGTKLSICILSPEVGSPYLRRIRVPAYLLPV